jgi:Fe-S-cluster containining protein
MLSNPRVRIIYEDNGHELREREKPFWNGDLSYRSKPYYEKNIPCIFLKNNKCEIYSVRPLVCATHLSLDQCKKEDEGTRLVNPKQFRDMCVQMYIRICQFTDIPFLIAPMPVMLRMGNIYLNAGSKGLIDTYGEDVLNPEKMIARWIPFEI